MTLFKCGETKSDNCPVRFKRRLTWRPPAR
jgi:hypothetical protein